MAENDLQRQLRALLSKVADEEIAVGLDDNLFQLGVLDSIFLIRLVSEIEKTFGISVADREMIPDYFLSIHRVSLYVQEKLAQSGAAPAQES
jgi:acyl carrier protein